MAAFLVVFLLAPAAAADGVTLEHAIEEGARRGPIPVEAARNKVAADAFASDHGGGLPSQPIVSVQAGVRAPRTGPAGPEVYFTAEQQVSFRGLGAARKDAAEWSARAAASELERARLEGAASAALEWIELLAAQELLRVRTTAAADAVKLAKIADARATAGVVTGVERALAAAEVGTAKLGLLDAEGKQLEARLSLAMALGRSFDTPLVAEGKLEATSEALPDGGAVLARAMQNPAFLASNAHARQLAADAKVTHAQNGPVWSFGTQVWHEGGGDNVATAIVTVPLPFFDPARYETALKETLAASAAARTERLRVELERETRLALHEHEHTREVRAALQNDVLVPTRTALATAVTAYAAGTSDLSVVLLARRSALQAEEQAINALADVQRADVRLATVSGSLVRK